MIRTTSSGRVVYIRRHPLQEQIGWLIAALIPVAVAVYVLVTLAGPCWLRKEKAGGVQECKPAGRATRTG